MRDLINIILSKAKDSVRGIGDPWYCVSRVTLLLLLSFNSACAEDQGIKVKIGIKENINRAYITANKNFQVIEDRSTDQGTFLDPIVLLENKAGKEVLLRSSPGTSNDLVVASAPQLHSTNSFLYFKCLEEPCNFTVKEYQYDNNPFKRFRGEIIIKPYEKDFTVINKLKLEDYLKGVIPGEMPVSWPLEALKAQAVAARTYTLKNLGRRSNLGFDLKASIEDQMYKGLVAEDSKTTKAINETRSEFLKDRLGLIVDAYYSSHAGQFSASPEDGWGLCPKHYLIPVKEPGEEYFWTSNITIFDLSHKLKDLRVGKIKAITILEKTMEDRVKKILVSSDTGHRILTGEEFRHKLGLKSTLFNITVKQSYLKITGFGFGHGIGLSQHGAKFLAKQGKNYKEILKYYYPGTIF